MFHNYFFIKRLANDLNDRLKGLRLLECFSQNKDELILGFASKDDEFILRANLDPAVSLLQFPEAFSRAGKNSIDLFQELIDQEVIEVKSFLYERSFEIKFQNGDTLIFKLHARRANILHTIKDEVQTIFRKSLSQDFDIDPAELNKSIDVTEQNFKSHCSDPNSMIPALGKEVRIHLEKMNFNSLDEAERWVFMQELLSELDHNPISLIETPSPRISLLNKGGEQTNNSIAACNWLYEKTTRTLFFDKEKEQLINKLKQQIRKSENYIIKTQEKLSKVEASRNPEELANILMANLHQIQTGLSKTVLTDVYTGEPITISLNTALSPQKNAENYYRKAKNRHQELDSLKANIKSKEDLIDQLSRQILKIEELEHPKELRKYKKEHGMEKGTKVKEENLPYHSFEEDGWTILVGKNSKANDELTLKVATKNDLWLHAKDVPGSHVVVRQKPGQNFPTHIIEKAASLAAANSKRKTDSLCPVIYTLKKFVRKAKGSPAGQVIVEKEEVVLIEPADL